MYRYVMEELQSDKLKYEHYVFVGFNVLNKVETKFFERLREAGKALFIGIMMSSTPACPVKTHLPTHTRQENSFFVI